MQDERFLTVKDVCQRVQLTSWTVRRAIKNNHLKAVKVSGGRGGNGGQWRIPEKSYLAWVESGTKAELKADGAGARR